MASFAAKADDGQDAAAVVEEANTPSTRQHSITDVKKLEADRAKDKKRVDKLLSAFDDSGEEVEAILCFTFWTLCQFEIDRFGIDICRSGMEICRVGYVSC